MPDGPLHQAPEQLQPTENSSPVDDQKLAVLPRVLSRLDAVAVVVGSIIGSGVFLKAKDVAEDLGSFGPILLVWAGIGLVTLCGSLALAELAAMMPQAGGPYLYLREAYGRMPAFLWGWTEFWIIRTGSLGALSTATVIYLDKIIQIPRHLQGPIAVGLILFLTLVNWRSTRWGGTVLSVTTVVKVAFLLLLISLPFLLRKASAENLTPMWPEELKLDFWRSVGTAAIAVLWAYDGWINIGPVAEDIRNPQRNIPVALASGILIIVLVYLGANSAYHLVLPMNVVARSEAVASDTFYVLLGQAGVTLAAVGVMCSTFGATQSNMLVGPRIYFAMARDDLLPKRLANVHAYYATPANAVLLQGIWASLLVVAAFSWTYSEGGKPGDAFEKLTDLVIFGGALFYAMAVAAVFVLRIRQPDAPRPYRTWGYPWTPALYLVFFFGLLMSLLADKWQPTLAGTALIGVGAVYYAWRIGKRSGR